jgi:hypothetical protein
MELSCMEEQQRQSACEATSEPLLIGPSSDEPFDSGRGSQVLSASLRDHFSEHSTSAFGMQL